MNNSPSMNTTMTAKQAYKVMFLYLDRYWREYGKPEEIGDVLSQMSLWETESGNMEPMDANIFPEFLTCVDLVLSAEETGARSEVSDILLDGKKPTIKVKR